MKYRIKNIIQNVDDSNSDKSIKITELGTSITMNSIGTDKAKSIANTNINEYSNAFILDSIKNNELLTNNGKIFCMKDNKENPNYDTLLLYSSDFSSIKFLTNEYNTVVTEVNNIITKNSKHYADYNKINLSADINEVK